VSYFSHFLSSTIRFITKKMQLIEISEVAQFGSDMVEAAAVLAPNRNSFSAVLDALLFHVP
jgi:hypothetical protein